MHNMDSLQQKITFGYFSIGGLIIGLALFAFVELRLIESQVLAGERVAEFFDTTLEMRRFEKNYFLYRQDADAHENQAYVGKAQRLIEDNFADFSALAGEAQTASLRATLDSYTRAMSAYYEAPPDSTAQRIGIETSIRLAGKEIVTRAEEIAHAERKKLQSSLDQHRRSLIVSIVCLILLVVAIGRIWSRRVVRPLMQMEESMEAIANGERSQIVLPSQDREIVSLSNAFNKVLQELETRQKHLVRTEKLASLGTLLSGVAHELNNPLSNISTSCQILAEEMDTADPAFQRELLEQIDGQTARARNIVRSLLDFARDREFKRETLPLAGLIAETLRFIKGQVPPRVTIVANVPADISVQGDKQRLQQVFLNLLNNALEALEGAGEIAIDARRKVSWQNGEGTGMRTHFAHCNPAGEAIEIEIRDNGHGIPPEVLPWIFDPFYTTKDVGKGSGLGLFVVYQIVEEHGGCIAAESDPAQGTVFHLRLPSTQPETQEPSDNGTTTIASTEP